MKISDILLNLVLFAIIVLIGFFVFEKYQTLRQDRSTQNDTVIQQLDKIEKLKINKEELLKEKDALVDQLNKKQSSPDYSNQINALSLKVDELSKKQPAFCPDKKDENHDRLWNRVSELEKENNQLRNRPPVVKREFVPNHQDKAIIEYYRELDKNQKSRISSLELQNSNLTKQIKPCEAPIVKPLESKPVIRTAQPISPPKKLQQRAVRSPVILDQTDDLPRRKINTQVDELN